MKGWVFLFAAAARLSFADCQIRTSNGAVASGLSDPLFSVLTQARTCPTDVFGLKEMLVADGLTVQPSMVANRGRHNPKLGSFSFFELASGHSESLGAELKKGQFYFGHFTQADSGTVDLDQSPADGKLLIELIIWDTKALHFNFYELIGSATGGIWFFRGNSKDAFLDNRALHLQTNPAKPVFGRSMRCSGCHTSGGPIMKELAAPHNDWWTEERPLSLGTNAPSEAMKEYLASLRDASEFASAVSRGQDLLEQSAPFQAFKKTLSLPEQLRPLFCITEINLVSADTHSGSNEENFKIPSEYWVGATFAKGLPAVEVSKADYTAAITALRFRFPETSEKDADHPWLAPVKARSDYLQIKGLLDRGVITEEFARHVQAIDLENPLFSKERCDLLRLVPLQPEPDWIKKLQEKLPHSQDPLQKAKTVIEKALKSVSDPDSLREQVRMLQTRRESVFQNEISKNPMGQILEPGFRVIFPVPRP